MPGKNVRQVVGEQTGMCTGGYGSKEDLGNENDKRLSRYRDTETKRQDRKINLESETVKRPFSQHTLHEIFM